MSVDFMLVLVALRHPAEVTYRGVQALVTATDEVVRPIVGRLGAGNLRPYELEERVVAVDDVVLHAADLSLAVE